MTRHPDTANRPRRRAVPLDLDLVRRMPSPLPPPQPARMIEQRLERWNPAAALLDWSEAAGAWGRLLPAPATAGIKTSRGGAR